MLTAPLPSNEVGRLEALAAYDVLDTPADPQLDSLTELAARICDTPIAMLSFIDGERQWFKSRVGVELTETPREYAICAHTILNSEPFHVPDLAFDPRFRDNPFVTEEPGVRVYLGMPLEVEQRFCIGTLCVIDTEHRGFTEAQVAGLAVLRDAVVNRLQLDRLRGRGAHGRDLLVSCAWCQRLRDDSSVPPKWQKSAHWLDQHYAMSHGICEDCASTLE